MTLSYSYGTMYQLWPRSEAVTLRKLLSTPGGTVLTETSVATAHKSIPERVEKEPTGGSYQNNQIIWRLPVALLDSKEPKPGDVIVDGNGNLFSITRSDYSNLFAEYRCETSNLEIYLPDSITIQRPTYTPNLYKLDVPTWNDVYSSISARVQPDRDLAQIEANSELFVRTYTVYVLDQLDLDPQDRVVWDGSYYTILSHEKAKRINDLNTIRMRSAT